MVFIFRYIRQEVEKIPHFANRMNIFICNLWLLWKILPRQREKTKDKLNSHETFAKDTHASRFE